MQEFLQLIRQQLILCLRLKELSQQQRDALVHTEPVLVQKLTKDIEMVIIDLNRLEKKRQEFLQGHQIKTAAQWVEAQPDCKEKNMLKQLLAKQAEVLAELKMAASSNMQYLDKNMSYISYNINVMTGTAAGATYGLPDTSSQAAVQGTKMFEANI